VNTPHSNDLLLNRFHAVFLREHLHPVTLLTSGDMPFAMAWIYLLAQRLLCEKNGLRNEAPCGVCGACIRIVKRASEAVLHLKPEGLQFKVDEAARAQHFISLQTTSRVRIIIFERADLLNPQAANILLKTLEEPPPRTLFFMTTPSAQDVLITLRSRSQLFKLLGQTITSTATLPFMTSSQSIEWKESRLLALNLFGDLIHRSYHSFYARWKAEITDREAALDVLRLWQELLRDVIFLRLKCDRILHSQESAILLEKLHAFSDEHVQNLSQACFRAEIDVKSNVDRILALESVWQSPVWAQLAPAAGKNKG
jgi:DNA polymerase-3 subunit delta'